MPHGRCRIFVAGNISPKQSRTDGEGECVLRLDWFNQSSPGRMSFRMVGIIARQLHDVFAVGVHRERLFLAGDDRNENEFFAVR